MTEFFKELAEQLEGELRPGMLGSSIRAGSFGVAPAPRMAPAAREEAERRANEVTWSNEATRRRMRNLVERHGFDLVAKACDVLERLTGVENPPPI